MGHALSRITMNNSSFAIVLALSLPLWPERTTAHKALVDNTSLQEAAYHLSRNMGSAARHTESRTTGFDNACAIARESGLLTVTEQY